MKITKVLGFACLLAATTFFSCSQKDEQTPIDPNAKAEVELQIEFMYKGKRIYIGTDSSYITPFGDQITFNKFQFHLTNLEFVHPSDPTKNWLVEDSYYLIGVNKTGEPASRTLSDAQEGQYKQIRFFIGVDSLTNHSIDLARGELDPNKDMVWSWSTGYIFWMLEGTYLKDGTPTLFAHHAGYDENLRTVTLDLNAFGNAKIQKGKKTIITLEIDLKEAFHNPHLLDLSTIANVSGKTDGAKIADNYVSCFAVKNVVNP